SSGGGRTALFRDAWRYRDYVIHSFNSDKPFTQFITEQLAGDLLNAKSPEERYWQLVATAYLLLGPTNFERQDKPLLEMDVIDEQEARSRRRTAQGAEQKHQGEEPERGRRHRADQGHTDRRQGFARHRHRRHAGPQGRHLEAFHLHGPLHRRRLSLRRPRHEGG